LALQDEWGAQASFVFVPFRFTLLRKVASLYINQFVLTRNDMRLSLSGS
jgi:hypothetical protein